MKKRTDLQLFRDYVYLNNIDYPQFKKIYRRTSKSFLYEKTFNRWNEKKYYILFKNDIAIIFNDNDAERKCRLCDQVKSNINFTPRQYAMGYLKFCNHCVNTNTNCHNEWQRKERRVKKGLSPDLRNVKTPVLVQEDKGSLSSYITAKDCPLRVENQWVSIKMGAV